MPQFNYIPEENQFLSLFPHRYDYLYADHVRPGESPQWHSETVLPLADRQIEQGAYLYGVRFGRETSYFLLDIDVGSAYHPKRDKFATGRICEALELLGITDHIAVSSSYSGGIHLYFPLPEAIASWKIASVVTQCLKYKGFIIEDGILEVLPNVRTFDTEQGKPSLFKGHRLPLQEGSYLLNDDWRLEWSLKHEFCKRWEFCQMRNSINQPLFDRLLREANQSYRNLTFKASKFLEDLNREIDPGWTGHGQTNFLLGRIVLRAYVFGHYLQGGEPLTGDRLVAEVVKTATRLPGYREFCNHQQEIWQRAEEWARCAENCPRYYPYGGRAKLQQEQPATPSTINWNQWQQQRARERICFALADMLREERLPSTPKERFNALVQYGISGETLYQDYHLPYWHPRFISMPSEEIERRDLEDSRGGIGSREPSPQSAKSLLIESDRNTAQGANQEWFEGWETERTGRNTAQGEGFSDLDDIVSWMKERSSSSEGPGDG